jgi:tRNA 2-selenouridine synthase
MTVSEAQLGLQPQARGLAHSGSIPSLAPEEVLACSGAVIIDLRSQSEFAEDHLPGARHVPLFDDVGRALIGTLYKQVDPRSAFEAGAKLARERAPELVQEIGRHCGWQPERDPRDLFDTLCSSGLEGLEARLGTVPLAPPRATSLERPVVLHCWRGGLRSRSVVALLRGMGLERAVVLEGGYKRYRACVLGQLERWVAPPSFVLRGLTGVGKTLVLREIERLEPGWTIDLEALAGHRSSILGAVGLEPCSQKAFESRLAERLRSARGPVAVLEGESRKVGDAQIHPAVWRALERGVNLELVAPTERRVQVLVEDYLASDGSRGALREQLPFIEKRLGQKGWAGVLTGLLDRGRERELVRMLLEHYYDPLYRHSERGRVYRCSIECSDPAHAASEAVSAIRASIA